MIPGDLVAALHRFSTVPTVVVASDYDGVLSPIVDDPAAATPDRAAVTGFLAVAQHPTVTPVIISGRSREALLRFLGDLPAVELVGNHGADLVDSGDSVDATRISNTLAEVADRFPGAHVEPKPHGAAFHYRRADDRAGARAAARSAADDLPGRTIEGKEVVEVVVGDATKGTAIESIRRDTGAGAVLYLGDDVTDEDVFRSLGEADVGIKVGDGDTAATHRIESVRDVAEVFRILDRALSSAVDGDR